MVDPDAASVMPHRVETGKEQLRYGLMRHLHGEDPRVPGLECIGEERLGLE
jgi:hypothetical protein